MPKDPNQVAANWAARLAQSGEKIQQGVQSVSVAPGAAAARQKATYVANVQSSADKWAQNVQAVTLSEWQQATISKGVPRIAAGAQAAQPKMAAFLQQFLPAVESARASLPPRGNLEQNLQRANEMARKLHAFRRR